MKKGGCGPEEALKYEMLIVSGWLIKPMPSSLYSPPGISKPLVSLCAGCARAVYGEQSGSRYAQAADERFTVSNQGLAQGRPTTVISMIKWIRTSRLSIQNSLYIILSLWGSGTSRRSWKQREARTGVTRN